MQIVRPHLSIRGGGALSDISDDDSDPDNCSWLRDLGSFNFSTRQRVEKTLVQVSDLRDLLYVPNWVSVLEEEDIIRRAYAAPASAWTSEAGRRFQVNLSRNRSEYRMRSLHC